MLCITLNWIMKNNYQMDTKQYLQRWIISFEQNEHDGDKMGNIDSGGSQ